MPRKVATGDMPDFTGYTIDGGRYLLDKLLGSGAYGKVYRAVDLKSPSDNRALYAIKCMPIYDPRTSKAEFQRRELVHHPMVRDHPNIVRFERTFRDEDWIYVVMELVEGGDLFAAITERRIFQNNDALVKKVYLQILDALQFCHSKGIFHRDIKPENILCSEDDQHIKLADFGLSTRSTASAEYGCGSCYYMSPECIGEKKPRLMYSSKQTDVWSMGVILVNMISGRNPWRYATRSDQCYLAYLRDNDFLGNVLQISGEANTIIKRIFTLDPFERITLDELKEEVTNIPSFFRTSSLAKMAGTEQPPESIETDTRVEIRTLPSGRHDSQIISLDDEGAFSSPAGIPPKREDETSNSNGRPAGQSAFIHGSNVKASHGDSSGTNSTKSSLPIKTPSVHAVDAVAVAQPNAAYDDVDDSFVLPGSLLTKVMRSPRTRPKSITIRNGRNIIRSAVQRIKDFSAPSGSEAL